MKIYYPSLIPIIGAILMACVVGWVFINQGNTWRAFKVEHKCEKVTKIEEDVILGSGLTIMPDGQVGISKSTFATPGKKAWRCDDGSIHWKDRE